jgi:hypothetical protein
MATMTRVDADRVEIAVTAAAAVARRFGMAPVEPAILRDSHHVSIRLSPFAIVARVLVSKRPDDAVVRLSRELDVARHLAARGAPIVCPAADPPSGPHVHAGTALSFWMYAAHAPAIDTDAVIAGNALRTVHEMLIDYSGELPAFTDAIEGCRFLLRDRSLLPGLAPIDRTFLLDQYERLLGTVAGDVNAIPLHGDAHLGNVLITSGGALWTDFESTCRGPLEWELSSLPEESLVSFPSIDRDLLAALRDLRSLCVAVWCWNDIDHGPDKREAAHFHLHRLRERIHGASTI